MTATLALQLLTALLSDFPEVIADVKKIVAAIEGRAPANPETDPLGPKVAQDTQALENQLKGQ